MAELDELIRRGEERLREKRKAEQRAEGRLHKLWTPYGYIECELTEDSILEECQKIISADNINMKPYNLQYRMYGSLRDTVIYVCREATDRCLMEENRIAIETILKVFGEGPPPVPKPLDSEPEMIIHYAANFEFDRVRKELKVVSGWRPVKHPNPNWKPPRMIRRK